MLFRSLALLLIAWLLGFVWFAVTLPRPTSGGHSAAVIVLTGSAGRVERGLALLTSGNAGRLLVTGVDRQVKPGEFAAEYAVPARLMRCCVTLGFDAVDTRSNAREAVRWLERNQLHSARIVTSDWHMRRARFELGRTLPTGFAVIEDAVSSQPTLRVLFLEYNKLLARWVQAGLQR